jgi:Cft2 family RNA processing exonuclease
VSIYFRSYCSSSAGNCLAFWTGDSCVLIDCGVKALRDSRALVRGHREKHGPVTALLVSHAHGDHFSGMALRVMEEEDIPIRAHKEVVAQLRARHGVESGRSSPIQPLAGDAAAIGDFRIATIRLSHAPGVATFGFVIHAGHGSHLRKIVVGTDFSEPSDLLAHLAGADFVFVEANHDLELLRRNPNFNSRYHLSNGRTARLLVDALGRGTRTPRNVVLGHLSDERNRERLALHEVERAFATAGKGMGFELETAPKYHASRVIKIAKSDTAADAGQWTASRLPFDRSS